MTYNTIKFAQYDRDVHANDGDDHHPHSPPLTKVVRPVATHALYKKKNSHIEEAEATLATTTLY